MDPDVTLARLRILATAVKNAVDSGMETMPTAVPDEMAELVNALDGWISKGGFLPSDWRAKK